MRDDIETGEVWPEELHGAGCDGFCGELGGCLLPDPGRRFRGAVDGFLALCSADADPGL